MFIAELFTIAKTWKQPVSIMEQKDGKKRCGTHTHTHTPTHTMGYCLTIKKNGFFAICHNMGRGIMFSEISQIEKDKYYMISCMWNHV